MTDNMRNIGEPDRSLIALGQDHEVQYWTTRFGVSEEKLREAVRAVGNSAVQVSAWLRARK